MDAALDHGLELRERLQRGLADALILVDALRAAGGLAVVAEHGRVDRQDLALEAALVARARGLLLRGEAEAVDLLARDAAVLRDPLGRAELIGRRVPGPVGGHGRSPGR